MNKKLLALLYYKCLFLSAFIGFAQENVNFINLKNSFSQTSHLEIDDFGYLWISNTNGLNKYNGDDFLFIPYKDIFGEDFIPTEKNLFTKDAKGNFWIGSLNGDILKLKLNCTYKSYKNVVKSKQS
jgi:hypothetical protein